MRLLRREGDGLWLPARGSQSGRCGPRVVLRKGDWHGAKPLAAATSCLQNTRQQQCTPVHAYTCERPCRNVTFKCDMAECDMSLGLVPLAVGNTKLIDAMCTQTWSNAESSSLTRIYDHVQLFGFVSLRLPPLPALCSFAPRRISVSHSEKMAR